MRKICNVLSTTIVVAFAVMACNKPYGSINENVEQTRFIKIKEVRADYTPYSTVSKLRYTCPEEVSGSSNQAWCNVTKLREGEMEVKVDINKTIVSRNAVITLRTAKGDNVRIPISQIGIVLRTSPSALSLPAAGGVATFEVDSPIAFKHRATVDWLDGSYSVNGNTVTVELTENVGLPRSGEIRIEIPELGLSTSAFVEQLGNVEGLGLAGKFLGAEGTESVWYFNPKANNGSGFNGAWATIGGNYAHKMMRIGRINAPINPKGLFQGVWLNVKWKNTSDWETGYKIKMAEGNVDYEVVFTLDFTNTGGTVVWMNDGFYWGSGGMNKFLTNLAVTDSKNPSKTYKVVGVDNIDNPTEMTLRDVNNHNNWFTVTKTPVDIE